MAQLDILPGRRMRWREKSEKDEFGSREERHRLGRFVLRYCKSYLPVRVWVAKMTKKRRFAFTPVLVNGHAKNVLLCYKKFMVCMNLDHSAYWLQTYITSNKLYEQKRFQYFVWIDILYFLLCINTCVFCISSITRLMTFLSFVFLVLIINSLNDHYFAFRSPKKPE